MICQICKKDHSKKNDGPLTKCELRAYCSQGAIGVSNGKKYRAFGVGNRFQFDGAN